MSTRNQDRLLALIAERFDAEGVVPSYDVMASELGLASKSAVSRLVLALEADGLIHRLPNRARAIEPTGRTRDDVREGWTFRSGVVSLPLRGTVAAGVPDGEREARHGSVDVAAAMLGEGDHHALAVRGPSMRGAGIVDGDVVVMRDQDHAAVGDVVAVRVKGVGRVLKRLGPTVDGKVTLASEHPGHPDRVVDVADVTVEGRLVGLIRRY